MLHALATALLLSVAVPAAPLGESLGTLPPCPAEAERCVGLTLHLAVDAAGDPADGDWVREQLSEANRLFGVVGLGFEVAALNPLEADEATVMTRQQRDLLGRRRFSRGTAHVFMVSHLEDVDTPGRIRGVHWRDRKKLSRRWVIVADDAPSLVLAHELGHFFGLPHSRYPASIMNKRPRDEPPWEARGFVRAEQRILEKTLRRLLRRRQLDDRAQAAPSR